MEPVWFQGFQAYPFARTLNPKTKDPACGGFRSSLGVFVWGDVFSDFWVGLPSKEFGGSVT